MEVKQHKFECIEHKAAFNIISIGDFRPKVKAMMIRTKLKKGSASTEIYQPLNSSMNNNIFLR